MNQPLNTPLHHHECEHCGYTFQCVWQVYEGHRCLGARMKDLCNVPILCHVCQTLFTGRDFALSDPRPEYAAAIGALLNQFKKPTQP